MDGSAQVELPRYKCFKEVAALKIKGISLDGELAFEESYVAPILMAKDWLDKHNPEVGGYLVFYKDGYRSFSPAKAFEEGYAPLREPHNREQDRMFHVNDPGHDYEVHNVENGTQHILFIKKEALDGGELKTIHDGTTNEGVLDVILDRIKVLDRAMPSEYNKIAIAGIVQAICAMEDRTEERKNRGVEGKHIA